MKNGVIVEPSPSNRQEVQAFRPLSKLEVLTADNVEPALEAMLSSLDRLDNRVRLVLERDGTVLAAGRSLHDWLERSDCLTLQGRKLQAIARGAQLKLGHLLEVGVGQIETQLINLRSREGHCILRAAGLCPEALALTMHIADSEFEPKLADLETAFGLTPSEARIVELLQQGHGPQVIGAELNISVHTVRAHLRHCYEKLEVSSKEELWQKLAPYRLN